MSEKEKLALSEQAYPKVYLLPNLMTAGNLFCGFMAILQIFEGTILRRAEVDGWILHYQYSLFFILGAFLFDMLDGRVARQGGQESPFGKQFDSLADLISFGAAPALMVFKIVLFEMPNRIGWFIAFIYLVCGALRLARFNVMTSQESKEPKNDNFTGIPIPAAAGIIASITLLILHIYSEDGAIGNWKYLLGILLLVLSYLMMSRVQYPSFKSIHWRTRRPVSHLFFIVLLASLLLLNYRYGLAFIFTAYMLSGPLMPVYEKYKKKHLAAKRENPDK